MFIIIFFILFFGEADLFDVSFALLLNLFSQSS